MAELTVSTLIKIILGILVVGALIYAAYYFFKHKIIDFFSGFTGGQAEFVFSLVKSNFLS
jgi:hypothetical protein